MKAAAIAKFGDAENLALSDFPIPRAKTGEVTIDVAYAGVNFAEVMYRQGLIPVELPYIPGIEVSGYIREIGAGVAGFSTGDAVVGLTISGGGGYAEVVAVDARLVAKIPENNPNEDRLRIYAAAPSNTVTAILIAERVARLHSDDAVLVHAAAGGFGLQFGQIARVLGVESVTGTVGSASKAEIAREFGYSRVLLRGESVADADAEEFDVIVDPVGGEHRARELSRLSPGGRVIVMGNASGEADATLSANSLWYSSAGMVGHSTLAFAQRRPDTVAKALGQAVAYIAAGEVTVPIHSVFSLAEADKAHRAIETSMTTGKLVLRIHDRM